MRQPPPVNGDFQLRHVEVDGVPFRFRVYVPNHYDGGRAWPAVLFLHGAGERGNDSLSQTGVGIGRTLTNRKDPYPAIVILPQCPKDSHWSLAAARQMAIATLDSAISEFNIDKERVALTGISMGGAGAWLLAAEHPGRFAKLAPVCGWVHPRAAGDLGAFARKIRHIPTWILHGDRDTIVQVEESRFMNEALKAAGCDVRYTEFAGVGHNSWDPAYGETELLEWMAER